MSKIFIIETEDKFTDEQDFLKKIERDGYKKGRAEIEPLMREIASLVAEEAMKKLKDRCISRIQDSSYVMVIEEETDKLIKEYKDVQP